MPYDNSKFEPEDTNDDYSLGGMADTAMYDHFINELARAQYLLKAHPNGHMCGHHVYKLQPLNIVGVKAKTYFWQPLPYTEEATKEFLKVCSYIDPPEGLTKESFKRWVALSNSVAYPEDSNTKLYKQSRKCVRLANDIRFTNSLKGEANADSFKLTPQVSWFTPELQQLDARDLLSLFPDAEASTFLLTLGRALVGASGEKCREGILEHTFRSMVVVIGTEPGLGKSTLLQGIVDVMHKCGYVTDILKTKGRFGWASPVLADLAYNDDLNKHTQKQLLTNDHIKTIVTGGTITTEEKGVKDVSLKCRAALISCSNYFNKADYIDMDGGEISRANLLYTHIGAELDRMWLDRYPCGGRPAALWAHLCEKYKCTTETLFAYLCARAAELFLDTVGYSVATGSVQRIKKDSTQELIESNRSRYRYAREMSNLSDLVDSVVHGIAINLAGKSEKKAEVLIERLREKGCVFDPLLLRAAVDYAATSSDAQSRFCTDAGYSAARAELISPACYKSYLEGRHLLDRPGIAITAQFEQLVGYLVARDGIAFPSKMGAYSALFAQKLTYIDTLVEEYRDKLETTDIELEQQSTALNKYSQTLGMLLAR